MADTDLHDRLYMIVAVTVMGAPLFELLRQREEARIRAAVDAERHEGMA